MLQRIPSLSIDEGREIDRKQVRDTREAAIPEASYVSLQMQALTASVSHCAPSGRRENRSDTHRALPLDRGGRSPLQPHGVKNGGCDLFYDDEVEKDMEKTCGSVYNPESRKKACLPALRKSRETRLFQSDPPWPVAYETGTGFEPLKP
jgi:hypothetical protein